MNLYDINREIYELLSYLEPSVDEETGEIFDLTADNISVANRKLEELQMAKEEKIENIACLIKNLSADLNGYDEEIKRLKKRMSVASNKIDWLKVYLTSVLNGEKFKSVKCEVSFRKSQKVEIEDDFNLPSKYIKQKIEQVVDKVSLKEDLKKGLKISGARLVESNNIQVK